MNLGMSIWVLIHPGRLGDVESTWRNDFCKVHVRFWPEADIRVSVSQGIDVEAQLAHAQKDKVEAASVTAA